MTARKSALLLLALLATPWVALAHSVLQSSRPSDGAHLAEAPTELHLRFNEPVELDFARLTLVGPDSATVALGALRTAPDSSRILLASIDQPLVAGEYTVQWQVAGADGHPVRGEFSFLIAPGAAGLAPIGSVGSASQPSSHHHAASLPAGPGFDASSPLYAAVRWLTFTGLVGVIGAVAFAVLVLALYRRRNLRHDEELLGQGRRRSAIVGLWATGALALATVLRYVAQAYALHGSERALDPALAHGMLTRTVWGWGWLLELAGVVIVACGFALAARGDGKGWRIAVVGALALAFVPALSGHAAAMGDLAGLAIAADTLHVLGAGGWMGGLLLLVAVGLPTAARLPGDRRVRAVSGLVNAFSPAALVFAGVVVATGTISALIHVASFQSLFQSAYGRTLLLKLGLLLALFGTGAYNWLRVKPALATGAAAGRLRRSAAVELAVGAIVLAVTAVLVATSPEGM